MIKIAVSTQEEENLVNTAMDLCRSMFEGLDNEAYEAEEVNATDKFLYHAQVSVTTSGTLDTALMTEIGKAYKEQHLKAKQEGDMKLQDRTYGAMMALKRLLDMVEAPKY